MDPTRLTIHEAQTLLRTRQLSAVHLTRALLDRIRALDGKLHAYLTVAGETALAQAEAADQRYAACARSGETPPELLGIPLSIKDNICTLGVRTTAGSKILDNFIPPFNATVMDRLEEAGAILLGKTNPDEFAMGSSTENSAYGVTHNPWDLTRVPGGSSGGSAAAVAADEALGALGTDTGGSVRQPASLCGIVGLRPTYGHVPRYGVIAFASSLDQVGPMTKDVRDTALLFRRMAGHDPKDATTMGLPVPTFDQILGTASPDPTGLVQGLRVGVPREYFIPGMQGEVDAVLRGALRDLGALGARLDEVSLPHTEYALPTYYLIAPAEASANLARYDGVKYGYRAEGEVLWDVIENTRGQGFGPEVKRRIMLGTYALSAGYYDAYYLRAQKVRTLIKQDFDRAFEHFDVLVGAASPTTAFRIGERADSPLEMYLADVFTLSQALAGICAISIPCGFAGDLPVGLQIMARAFDEDKLLRVAYAFEQATSWRQYKPKL